VADHEEAATLVASSVRAGDVVLFKASRVATLDRAAATVVAALRAREGVTA
jgi:UDP-N-acetylmuramyl pentapeptide synthase